MLVLGTVFFSRPRRRRRRKGCCSPCAPSSAAVAVARGFGRRSGTTATFAIGVLAVPIAWMVVDRLNGPGGDNIGRAAFAILVISLTAAQDSRPLQVVARGDRDGWPLASIGVLGAVARLPGAALVARAVRGALGRLVFSALVVVYYSYTAPVDWLLVTSADRVVFSLVLGLATVAPVLAVLAWHGMVGDSAEKRRSP